MLFYCSPYNMDKYIQGNYPTTVALLILRL